MRMETRGPSPTRKMRDLGSNGPASRTVSSLWLSSKSRGFDPGLGTTHGGRGSGELPCGGDGERSNF